MRFPHLGGARGIWVLTLCRFWERTAAPKIFLGFQGLTHQTTPLTLSPDVRSPSWVRTQAEQRFSAANTKTRLTAPFPGNPTNKPSWRSSVTNDVGLRGWYVRVGGTSGRPGGVAGVPGYPVTYNQKQRLPHLSNRNTSLLCDRNRLGMDAHPGGLTRRLTVSNWSFYKSAACYIGGKRVFCGLTGRLDTSTFLIFAAKQ